MALTFTTGNTFAAGDTVTATKLNNIVNSLTTSMSTAKLLGRATAGTGVIEEIDLTAAGRAILDDATAADQRTTLSAAGSGAVTASGLTMSTATMLARTTAGTGAIEELNAASGRSFLGVLTSRVASDFSKTSDTTLADITGLSVTLVAGRTYSFSAILYVTNSTSGGVKCDLSGTCTATSMVADALYTASGILYSQNQVSALTSTLVNYAGGGSPGRVEINGTITVNTGGTLTVRGAQSASDGTATVFKRGSTLCAQEVA